jgi:predicted LPLAT superfamily acyltransferase
MTAPAAAGHVAWTHAPERSNRFMMRLMIWISLHLGRRASRILLHPITVYFMLFAPASRRASWQYLQRALAPGGRTPGWGDVYRHFFSFAATIHDRIYLVSRRFDLFHIDVHGQAALDQLLSASKGVFLMGAHLGSFEVIRAIGRQGAQARVAMVMHEDNARKINAMLAAIRPDAAHDIIGMGRVDSMLKVWERLEEGYAIGILADRTAGDNDALHPVQILGAKAQLPGGPFRMAALLRRPAVFMAGLYLGGNRYAVHFEPLADFSTLPRSQHDAAMAEAITRYAALLDRYCRLAPYNWFNFFDFWQPPTAVAVEAARP